MSNPDLEKRYSKEPRRKFGDLRGYGRFIPGSATISLEAYLLQRERGFLEEELPMLPEKTNPQPFRPLMGDWQPIADIFGRHGETRFYGFDRFGRVDLTPKIKKPEEKEVIWVKALVGADESQSRVGIGFSPPHLWLEDMRTKTLEPFPSHAVADIRIVDLIGTNRLTKTGTYEAHGGHLLPLQRGFSEHIRRMLEAMGLYVRLSSELDSLRYSNDATGKLSQKLSNLIFTNVQDAGDGEKLEMVVFKQAPHNYLLENGRNRLLVKTPDRVVIDQYGAFRDWTIAIPFYNPLEQAA